MNSSIFNQVFSKRTCTIAVAGALTVPGISALPANAAPQDQPTVPQDQGLNAQQDQGMGTSVPAMPESTITQNQPVAHENTNGDEPRLRFADSSYDSSKDNRIVVYGSGYNKEGMRDIDGSVGIYIAHSRNFQGTGKKSMGPPEPGEQRYLARVSDLDITEDGSFKYTIDIPANTFTSADGQYYVGTFTGDPADPSPDSTVDITNFKPIPFDIGNRPEAKYAWGLDEEGNSVLSMRGYKYFNTDPSRPVHTIVCEYDPQTQRLGEHVVTDFTAEYSEESGQYAEGYFESSSVIPLDSFNPTKTYVILTTDNPENPQDSQFFSITSPPFEGALQS